MFRSASHTSFQGYSRNPVRISSGNSVRSSPPGYPSKGPGILSKLPYRFLSAVYPRIPSAAISGIPSGISLEILSGVIFFLNPPELRTELFREFLPGYFHELLMFRPEFLSEFRPELLKKFPPEFHLDSCQKCFLAVLQEFFERVC